VAEKLLNGSDVVPVFEEVRRKGVPKRVAGGTLVDGSPRYGGFDGALNHGLVEMMATEQPGFWIPIGPGRWEHPLPFPRSGGAWDLAGQGVGKFDGTSAPLEVATMELARTLELKAKWSLTDADQNPHP